MATPADNLVAAMVLVLVGESAIRDWRYTRWIPHHQGVADLWHDFGTSHEVCESMATQSDGSDDKHER